MINYVLGGCHLEFPIDKKPTNLCRGLSPHHAQQMSVQLVKRFQKRSLKFQPIRTHNWPWRPCFKFDPQTKNFVDTHPRNIPARFSSKWPNGFRGEDSNAYDRRRRQTPSDDNSSGQVS